MARPSRVALPFAAFIGWTPVAFVLAACGATGDLELRWTVGGVEPAGDAAVCAQHGLDAVEALLVRVDTREVHDAAVLPCRDGVGRLTGLDPADVDLLVSALSPAGRAIVALDPLPIELREDATAAVAVDLPPPARCSDGVDNDGDGRADLADLDCEAADGEEEGAAK